MDLILSKRQITSLAVIILVTVVLPSGIFLIDWFPETLENEVSNRNLLSALAHSGAAHLKENPETASQETILEAAKVIAGDSQEWTGNVHLAGIEDTWGSWLRLSEIEPGLWEWRSLGRDGYPGTEDDRASRFRAGEVVLDPGIAQEEEE